MDKEDNRPLYLQVEADIRNNILQKKYLPGQKLPTENEFCKIYGVSKITIRKAFELLTENHLVERQRGKGTFVKLNKEKVALGGSQGFSETLQNGGHTAKKHVLSTQRIGADEKIAEKLALSYNELVTNINRLILEDDVPIGLDYFYAADKSYPNLLDHFSNDGSLYDLLKKNYHVLSHHSTVEINGIVATPKIAEALQCYTGDPLFVINKTSYTKENTIIHYSSSIIRCDRVKYVINITDDGLVKAIEMG